MGARREWDIAISFAAAERNEARRVADGLRRRKLRVFFDEHPTARDALIARDGTLVLPEVFRTAPWVAVLASRDYIAGKWTGYELAFLRERALLEGWQRIVPVFMEPGVELPGVPTTIIGLSWPQLGEAGVTQALYDLVRHPRVAVIDEGPDDVLAVAWREAQAGLRGPDGARELSALIGDLLAAAGVRDVRHRTEKPPAWRGHLGEDPERWAFAIARTRADVVAARRIGKAMPHEEVLAIVDVSGVVPPSGVDRDGLVLGPDPDRFGLCDLLAAGPRTFWGFRGLAARLKRWDISEARLEAAAAHRVATCGTFVEQAWQLVPDARQYARLRGAAQVAREALVRIQEYRGVAVTVPRAEVERQLDHLVTGKLDPSGSGASIVALIGPQGIGKTSALCSFIERHPDIPAFFVLARQLDFFFRDRRWTLSESADVPALVRAIDGYRATRPHLLLCLDGLNEGDADEVARALESPATAALLRAGGALAVSCWPAHWKQRFRRLCGDVVEVVLDEFSDHELEDALARRGTTRASIPASLWQLARRPALLDHILRLRDRLASEGPVSRMDVFWADLQYKAEKRWIDAPGEGSELKAHLIALIRNYQERVRTAPGRTGALASEVARWPGGSAWLNGQHKLMTLEDFDVIRIDREGKISLADETVAVSAMALLLCDELHLVGPGHREKLVRGRKVLDEIADLTEPSEATLQALGFSLGHDDSERTLALLVLLLDNRNFEPNRLREFGHRLVRDALTITRFEISDDLLENSTICRTRAEDLVIQFADERDFDWILALITTDRADDANLIHSLVDHHTWPALMDPIFRAVVDHPESGRRVDEVVAELISALVDAYDLSLRESVVAELEATLRLRRRPRRSLLLLARGLGDPAFVEPLLALAERASGAAHVLDALPEVDAPDLERRLQQWLARHPRAADAAILEWAVAVGSPLALEVLRRAGATVLARSLDDELCALVLGAARDGWSHRLVAWAQRARVPDDDTSRTKLAKVLAYAAVTALVPVATARASLARAARLKLPFDGNFVGVLHDLPLTPERRLRATRILRAVARSAGADDWLRAEVDPDRVAMQLADELRGSAKAATAVQLLDSHVHWLLPATHLRPDDIRRIVDRAGGDEPSTATRLAQAALRLLCFYELPGKIALAERTGPEGIEPGVLSVVPLAGELADHVATCLRLARPSPPSICTMLAIWEHHRGPLPADVDRWVGRALATLHGRDLTIAVDLAIGTVHQGLGSSVRRLCGDGSPLSFDRQWALCSSAVAVDRALARSLLERASGPDELVALERLARRRVPGSEEWLDARLRALVDVGTPVRDENTIVRIGHLLPALVLHEIEPTVPVLERFLDLYTWDDHAVVCGLITWVARWRPQRLAALLKDVGRHRSSGELEHAMGLALSVMRRGERAHVLAALCLNREPSEVAPRPSLDSAAEHFNAFRALAGHPPTHDELEQASASVDRRWRGNLAQLAVFADDGGEWLARMEEEEHAHGPRHDARHAQLRRDQRTHVSEMLRRLAVDPLGTLQSPLALHLALRLDGTHQHEIDAVMQGSFEARRALSWILRSARNRPTDWIPTP